MVCILSIFESFFMYVFSYDCDEGLSNPKKADELGSIKVNLSEIVQGHLRHGRLLDDSGNKNATLYVTARETVDCRVSG